ncbi:hypothetical protein Cadr_000017457 [Camelus dromedarius]|uniref:Uncharacterized protein n=1 Tax=Camelus dromedarius TaxID=9838 RepID=A0A5N4DET1_CAMDR|nr:hypothetical protein Cadr_000017457 [Camelus dromedarius]
MASHCLSVYVLGLCILWCRSLQVGGGLPLILAQKLCVELLLPVQQALGQLLTVARGWGLQLLTTLIHGACRCILFLVDFHRENSKALELLLGTVLQQVAASLLVRCLDRLWVAMRQVTRAMRGSGLQSLGKAGLCPAASKDLDAVTTILPAPTIPLSQCFPGPDPATLSRLTPASINLCLVAGDKDASEGQGGCGLGVTKVPISTRFQSCRTGKMAFSSSPKQALTQQVKAICVLIILLYIYAACLFVQILK